VEGIAKTAAARPADCDRVPAGISFYQVEGNHYAWKPVPGDELSGELSHGRTEGELLAKLAARPG